MKVILYMAISVNGNITKGKDDSDWVDEADWKTFNKITKDSGVMVMGSETYKQFADDFPQKGILNVVVTKKKNLLVKNIKGAMFTDKSPKEIIKELSKKGFEQMTLIGGEKLNTSFIMENLVDEIYVDIHPYLIGEGLKLFSEIKNYFKMLRLIEITKIGQNLILLHYKIIK